LTLAVALGAATMAFGSAGAADFTDLAPVVATRPIVEQVSVPRQECWNETVTVDSPQPPPPSNTLNPAGAIIGGVAGGVVGHQIGSGRGNDVATVAGTIAGALIGNNIANKAAPPPPAAYNPPTQQVVQRCQTVNGWQDVIRGYDVTYRYGGRDATVRLPYDPGPNVRVGVAVIPDAPPQGYPPPPPPRR
jgi:uncharacterized protein YcfJ